MDWKNPQYLQKGNPKQKKAYELIVELGILTLLKDYDPVIVGTIPIEIDLPESDIDIICEVPDIHKFKLLLTNKFQAYDFFIIKKKNIRYKESVVAQFIYKDYAFEIFGQNVPTHEQYAYRHMLIEYQLLNSRPPSFRKQIVELKKKGLKTEAAFASLLELEGDPFEALLQYEKRESGNE